MGQVGQVAQVLKKTISMVQKLLLFTNALTYFVGKLIGLMRGLNTRLPVLTDCGAPSHRTSQRPHLSPAQIRTTEPGLYVSYIRTLNGNTATSNDRSEGKNRGTLIIHII